ncbi:hypothetical protein PLEOSDRAFT_1087149 [Pleurotus ostreatus PC15]|uniref:Uncharacterized protein n=1 Tax=Pleurotus ostreatus (strain PC15) TaxID=1137138 RepID=A0A067NEJ7_PLEO1|nr:hypothetical protein PLEOSDRAFT_1087149 [Pleurotus ostreatus PC15]
MKPYFHPYNQDRRPARASSNNGDAAYGNQSLTVPQGFGASQARGSMAGWYEQALPPVDASSTSSANSTHANPGNPYPVVTPSTSTNADVALYYSQHPASTSGARILPPGGSDTLGQDAQPLPQRAPQLRFARLAQPQPQPQAFSGSANMGHALGRPQWDVGFNYLAQPQALYAGYYSNSFLSQQTFPPLVGSGYLQNDPLEDNLQMTSHTASSAGQNHPQNPVNGSYFGFYPPVPAPGNGASQELFARPQILPQGFAVPSTRASDGIVGPVPAASYDGGYRHAPYQSAKAQVEKGRGRPKKTRSSWQDQNRSPVPRVLAKDEAECPRPNCDKVMKKANIRRHLRSKFHGGEGTFCPLCDCPLSRSDCVPRHIKKYCPNRNTSNDATEEQEDDDEEDDTLLSTSTSDTQSPLIAAPEQVPQASVYGAPGLLPALAPLNAKSTSSHSDTLSPHAASEGSLNGSQYEGGYTDDTHPALPAAYNYLYPYPEDTRYTPTPPLDAAPCDIYADDAPDPGFDGFDNILEYWEESFDPQGSLADARPDEVWDNRAEDTIDSLDSTAPGNNGSVLAAAFPTAPVPTLAPRVEGHGPSSEDGSVYARADAAELSGDDTADPVAGEQNADTPNDVAGLGLDSDDLEDALIHEFDNHDYGGESNDLYDLYRSYGLEDLFGDTHSVGEEKGEGGNDKFVYYY